MSGVSVANFFDTFDCRSGRHCCTCRDRDLGRSFRTSIAAYFHLPSADFPCPHSRPWGLTDSPASLFPVVQPAEVPPVEDRPESPAAIVTPAEAQRRFAICSACGHSRDNGFACALHPGCCLGKFRAGRASHCPAAKW